MRAWPSCSHLGIIWVFLGDDARSLPQNSAFEPILGDFAEILGKVVAVLRSL